MSKFETPMEEMRTSLEKIQEPLTQESCNSSLRRQVMECISDAIILSTHQQFQATEDFNQSLAQKRQERSS